MPGPSPILRPPGAAAWADRDAERKGRGGGRVANVGAVRLPFTRYGAVDLALSTAAWAAVVAFSVAVADRWPALWAVGAVATGVWALLLNFFRDPERIVPSGEGLLVSPADGRVTDIVDVDEPQILRGPATRLGIFLSPLDVHVNRMPIAGRVTQRVETRGKMLRAYDPLAATENQSCAVGLEVAGGHLVVVRQVTGAVARRIVCPVRPGDRFRAGERYGMIKLGSRTEVWVPKSLCVKWSVSVGDRVLGGATVLGVVEGLPREAAAEVAAASESAVP